MQRRVTNLFVMTGLPVLIGLFIFDCINRGLQSAVGHLPVKAIVIFAVLLVWAAFREHRERKKRTSR